VPEKKKAQDSFVLGLDLDGCVVDFVGSMREVFAEWSGKNIRKIEKKPTYGMKEWGLVDGEYERLHRYAVTQKNLFAEVKPIKGAPQSLRRLSTEGVWIRVATHRLFIPNFHATAAQQTILWLEKNDIRYWDLCLIEDKTAVRADLFIEDSPSNIHRLLDQGTDVICMTNPINNHDTSITQRAKNWKEAETMIRSKYNEWRFKHGLPSTQPGIAPDDERREAPNE
jgi:5'(3')-deoxyribonucleotidase